MNKKISWENFHTIIFDFDGVFTDNKVIVSENGLEQVICDRADGLGINILKKFIKKQNWGVEFFILSTEKNPVVLKRAEKLKIISKQSITNKYEYIQKYLKDRFGETQDSIKGVIFLGNDLNDLEAIEKCGFSVCPKNAHPRIKIYADKIIDQEGGYGFVREFIEFIIGFNEFTNEEIKDFFI